MISLGGVSFDKPIIKAILEYDQQVSMPEGSVNGRSEQLALIEEIYHKKLISRETGLLIEKTDKEQNLNLIESALLREIKYLN